MSQEHRVEPPHNLVLTIGWGQGMTFTYEDGTVCNIFVTRRYRRHGDQLRLHITAPRTVQVHRDNAVVKFRREGAEARGNR